MRALPAISRAPEVRSLRNTRWGSTWVFARMAACTASARAHLWHPVKFGVPYPALSRATDAIDRFLLYAAQVGIRPHSLGVEVYAPHGFDDIAAMILRPNTSTLNFRADLYENKAQRWKACWPELTVIPARRTSALSTG